MATTLATEKQAEAIKRRMAEIRTELPYSADGARRRVKQLTDWKYHLSKHPLPILAATAVVGYLLVPSKRSPERIMIHSSATDSNAIGSSPTASPQRSLVVGIASAVASVALQQMATMAVIQLSNLITKRETQ